jgi:hypothetical protein
MQQVFSRDHVVCMFGEHRKHTHHLGIELLDAAGTADFACSWIYPQRSKLEAVSSCLDDVFLVPEHPSVTPPRSAPWHRKRILRRYQASIMTVSATPA